MPDKVRNQPGKASLVHLASRIFDTPLMIQPNKLDVILNVLGPRLDVPLQVEADPDVFGIERRPMTAPEETVGSIAILPIHGSLVHRTTGLQAMSGLLSYDAISHQIEELANDESVAAIVLDVDSPGGEVGGVFDVAERIFEARQKKPVYAIANAHAFSAAYLIAAAANKIYLTRTSAVGSVGVLATHIDISRREDKEGITVTHIYAGERKVDLSPHRPLSDSAEADLQAKVDETYEIFAETVARYRDMSVASVKATKAGIFMGKAAVKAGLADAVHSVDEALGLIVKETYTMKEPKPSAGHQTTASGPAVTTEPAAPAVTTATAEPAPNQPAATAAPAEPAPAAATVAAATAVVTGLSEQQLQAERERAAEITEACALVNQPQLASEYIKQGLTAEQARAKLFTKMSTGEAHIVSAAASDAPKEDEGVALMRAAAAERNAQTH